MRVSELREQLDLRFAFEKKPVSLFHNGTLLINEDTIPTDRGWEKRSFEIKSEGRIEQVIWCRSLDFPLTSFKLPLNATTDDLQDRCRKAAKTEDPGQYTFTVSSTLTFGMVKELLAEVAMGFDQLDAVFQPDISQLQVTMRWGLAPGKPKEEEVTCIFKWPGSNRQDESLTVPRDTTIGHLFTIAQEQLKLGEYDWLLDPHSKGLFDTRSLVKNIREPRYLHVVSVIWVDAQCTEAKWRFPARLKATVGQFKAELMKTFGDVEIGAITGEILEASFELAQLAQDNIVSVLVIHKVSVGRVQVVTLDGQKLEFLVDTTRNIGAMKTIIAGRLAVNEASFDIRDQKGMLRDATIIRDSQGDLTCVGRGALIPVAPDPQHTYPQAAGPAKKGGSYGKTAACAGSEVHPDPWPVQDQDHQGAGPVAPEPPKLPTEKPHDYDRNLDHIDEMFPLIDRRVCARCYNFHNYNFNDTLTELLQRNPQPAHP
jgi:hypothetical protein